MPRIFNAIDLHTKTTNNINLGDDYLENIVGIFDGYAYVADHCESIIQIVDITHSVLKGTYTYQSEDFFGLQVIDNYAYLAGGESGIEIFDVEDVSNPVFVNQLPIPSFSLDANERYLYVKDSSSTSSLKIVVFEINGGDLIVVNEVLIPEEDCDFRIKNGIIYYVSVTH